ncbi:MAG: hypothetical protein JWM11_4363 [Planctomycetaceae bacterium]|nr:hypothetical protein [Planctomycetaceae bacterium]
MRARCVPKWWAWRFLQACVLILLGGCQTAAPSMGPIYRLHEADIPEPTTPVAVSIDDKRPKSELTFHAGSVELVDFANAIDVLTVDNFEPGPIELLKKSLAVTLSELTLPPTWAEVELRSFRVVVNRSSIMEVEYERQRQMSDGERMAEQQRMNHRYNRALAEYRKACKLAKKNGDPPPAPPRPPPSYLPPSAAPAVGVGVGMTVADGGGFGGIIGGIGAGLLAAAIVSDIEDQQPAVRRAVGVGVDALPGVTCTIGMHVRLHWPDGRREEFNIASNAHAPPPPILDFSQEDPLMLLTLSVNPTVQKAMEQASAQLASKGAAFLSRTPPPGAKMDIPKRGPSIPVGGQ